MNFPELHSLDRTQLWQENIQIRRGELTSYKRQPRNVPEKRAKIVALFIKSIF